MNDNYATGPTLAAVVELNSMDDINSKVTYTEKNISECYFNETVYKTLDYKSQRGRILAFLALVVLSIIGLIIAKRSSDYLFAFVFFILPAAIQLFFLVKYFRIYFSWRISINRFIKYLLSFSSVHITANESGIGVTYDDEITFRVWDTIHSTQLTNKYLKIVDNAGGTVLLPKDAIDKTMFLKLVDILKERGKTIDYPHGQ